jgi:superfamily II DNA/RNA helicase
MMEFPMSIDTQKSQVVYTPYQRQYWAHLLTSKSPPEDAISRSIASARVDMNPHQVEGALFAVRSPLSKGIILADEVGLGKTIEASLVIAQRWAERKRRILLIVPASLRKQWAQELFDKFSLKAEIIEAKSFNFYVKQNNKNPFDQAEKIFICSYQFAARKAPEIKAIPWDLVVFDEAHKLRNIYKKDGNKTAKALCDAIYQRNKLLLSATPLQNSLMELYGLVSVIDPHFFGSDTAFKQQYVNSRQNDDALLVLKNRLKNICYRTLRRQVQAEGGINFTRRLSLTQDFTPSSQEQDLYEKVSSFLQREGVAAITKGNKALITLVIRKILASSSFAIAGTLNKMIDRLEKKLNIDTEALTDYDAIEEVSEELDLDEQAAEADKELLKAEIEELKQYEQLARAIRENAKGQALITVLETVLDKVEQLGGPRKAVIFTESCRTQSYLKDLLDANGYEGQIILLNGSNSDPISQSIYKSWLERYKGSDEISGSKSADMKAAIVDAFRNKGNILITTESGAEGINLQFCSLVVNYDLPWNPQRVEQRIGRCHRYGQKHDVVVVNFINKGNRADERVFQLLDEKFKLFNGVFGVSDEILGAIESGVDIEQRIHDIYQKCRPPEEIEAAFEKIQHELDESIAARESSARQILLENFDEAVHQALRSRREKTQQSLTDIQQLMARLSQSALVGKAKFFDLGFEYQGERYWYDWQSAEQHAEHFFHLGDERLADQIIANSFAEQLPPARIQFNYNQYGAQLMDLKSLIGSSGWLELSKLRIDSIQTIEFLVISAFSDSGVVLDPTQCRRLLNIPADIIGDVSGELPDQSLLASIRNNYIQQLIGETETKNKQYFEEESQKLDSWAEESLRALTQEISDLMAEIKALNKQARLVEPLQEKIALQRESKTLQAKRTKRQMEFFESQNKIAEQQETLLDEVASKLKLTHTQQPIFLIRWSLV